MSTRNVTTNQPATNPGRYFHTWSRTACQDGIYGGVVEANVCGPHPSRPGMAFTLATVHAFDEAQCNELTDLITSAPQMKAVLLDTKAAISLMLETGHEPNWEALFHRICSVA